MQRDHDELKIFLKICLIPSRIDQKLSLKRRNTLVLKRELARRSWAIDAFVGAVFKRRGGDSLGMGHDFNSATNRLVFSFNFTSYLPRFSPRFSPRSRHDRVAIGRRSWLGLRRSPADRWEANPRRSRAKLSSIAARSRRDRGVLPRCSTTV